MFRIEIEREEDGRILASIPELPGVMAYGRMEAEAIRKVKAIAGLDLEDVRDGLISESRREETGVPLAQIKADVSTRGRKLA